MRTGGSFVICLFVFLFLLLLLCSFSLYYICLASVLWFQLGAMMGAMQLGAGVLWIWLFRAQTRSIKRNMYCQFDKRCLKTNKIKLKKGKTAHTTSYIEGYCHLQNNIWPKGSIRHSTVARVVQTHRHPAIWQISRTTMAGKDKWKINKK